LGFSAACLHTQPAVKCVTTMSFFRTATIAATQSPQSTQLLSRLRQQELDGIVVKGVYDQATCGAVTAKLEAGQHGLIRTDFPAKFAAFFYGINLNLTHPDLREYFAEVPRFDEGLSQLLPASLNLEQRLTALMSVLDSGQDYRAAPGPQSGSHYMFTTLRAHLPGGYIPAHFDDEQASRPSYRHLLGLIHLKLFSFVLAFSQAEEGGALEIFNLKPQREGQRIATNDRSSAKPNLDAVERVSFRLEPGDMIIFNSGHYLHRVTPVVGGRTRWTACSFMAESKDSRHVYCWG
jgi:hypothetical protein